MAAPLGALVWFIIFYEQKYAPKSETPLYPPKKIVLEMGIKDIVGFNDGAKHWSIKRDE